MGPTKIPSITGNQALDSALAALILTSSGIITTWLVTLLGDHHIAYEWLPEIVGGIVLTTLIGAVTGIWRFLTAKKIPIVITAAQVQAANATLAMVAKNEMKTDDKGAPVPVTPGTIKQIVATHGTGDGTVKV